MDENQTWGAEPTQPQPDEETSRYRQWIETNVDATGGYGKCREICQAMASAFPELEVRKGVFHSMAWGERSHWWCRSREHPDHVVDPTAGQHPDGSLFSAMDSRYDDLTDMTHEQAIAADKVPVGKCSECGDPIWASSGYSGVCSQECGDSYARYLNTGEL